MYLKCKCLYFSFKTCHLSINLNVVCATRSRKLQNSRVTVVINNVFCFTGTQIMNLNKQQHNVFIIVRKLFRVFPDTVNKPNTYDISAITYVLLAGKSLIQNRV